MVKRSYTSQSQQDTPQTPQEFDLDGTTWVCEAAVSVLDLSEFARLAQHGVDAEHPEGMAILADVYSGLLGSKYQAFRDHCRRNRTDMKILVEIIGDLISDASDGRPTERPSDSSDGPTTGAATAKVVSLDRRTVEVKPIDQVPQPETQAAPAVVSYG